MFKWYAILGIIVAVGSGFVWYTHKIESDAIERQAAASQIQVYQDALAQMRAEKTQMEEHAKEQQRQIRLRDKVYHELKNKTQTLRTELSALSSKDNRYCDSLVVDVAVIDRLRVHFNQEPGPTGEDSVRETVPGDSTVPADYSSPFPGDDA